MTELKIGGVPEHFNFPWHLGIEDELFLREGIYLNWQDIPEGTGRMCTMLADGELDVAVILTGGILKSITDGNPARIIQNFVPSPLIWGIHTGAHRKDINSVQDLQGKKAAISRMGSGSHLMTYLLAQQEGWNTSELNFEIVNTIAGAQQALTEDAADFFLWEKFMTQPLVDRNVFKRVGEIPTPWPSFVIAATQACVEQHSEELKKMLEVINTITADFMNIPSMDKTLASYFDIEVVDIQQWMELTYYTQDQIEPDTIAYIQDTYLGMGVIDKKLGYDSIVTNL